MPRVEIHLGIIDVPLLLTLTVTISTFSRQRSRSWRNRPRQFFLYFLRRTYFCSRTKICVATLLWSVGRPAGPWLQRRGSARLFRRF